MNFVTDFCLPALVLSSAALVSLRLMGETSLRFRTSLAVIGLLAWFVPWSRLTLPVFALSNLPRTHWIGALHSMASAFEDGGGLAPGPATETPPAFVPRGRTTARQFFRARRGAKKLVDAEGLEPPTPSV